MTKSEIDEFDKIVLRFTADWCAPCKLYAPNFDKVANEFETIAKLVINVGSNEGSDLALKYGVLGIPSTLFLNKGQAVDSIHGNQPSEIIKQTFQKLKDI